MHIQIVIFGEIFNPAMTVVSRRYDRMCPRSFKLFCFYSIAKHPRFFIGGSAVNHPSSCNTAIIMHTLWIWIYDFFTDCMEDILEIFTIPGIPYNITWFLIGNRTFYFFNNFYFSVFDQFIIKFNSMNVFYRRLFPS